MYAIAVDAHDVSALARFWAQVLDWQVVLEEPDGVLVAAGPEVLPAMVFLLVPEGKAGKNRLHLDLTPGEGEPEAEVERILALGARRVDVGQGDEVTWTVLADPEGNEFCVLRESPSLRV